MLTGNLQPNTFNISDDDWKWAEQALYIRSIRPKKGKKMNEQLHTPPEVELTPEQAAKLAELAKHLETDGEVLLQTEEQVGTETPETRTVH